MEKLFYVGQEARESIVASEEVIKQMAEMSNDYNPIHMSEEFAEKTFFKKRIAHGLLVEALVSNLIGTKIPGPGSIFLALDFEFKKPIFINDEVTAIAQIIELLPKNSMIIEVKCVNQEASEVAICVAKVKYLSN